MPKVIWADKSGWAKPIVHNLSRVPRLTRLIDRIDDSAEVEAKLSVGVEYEHRRPKGILSTSTSTIECGANRARTQVAARYSNSMEALLCETTFDSLRPFRLLV